ncbi:hypothetical protein AAG906_012669 [Vitis piasezkii]
MGNDVRRNSSKRHYDITMSRRTRKALNLEESKKEIPLKGDGHEGEKRNTTEKGGEHDNDHKKSLKQLIHGDGNVKVILGEENKCRSSLGQHFTEDKQLQLVVKQQEEVMVGVKPKGSVSHYIKVLSHLIKVKQDSRLPSRKKPIIALTM